MDGGGLGPANSPMLVGKKESRCQGLGAVVITGASTGIGEACAFHLDKLGYRVFAGIRKAADGQSLRSRASEKLVPIRLDISDETEIREAARKVVEAVGDEGLAGLVNNAGIVVGGMLEFLPVDELRRQLEINVYRPNRGHAGLPAQSAQGPGPHCEHRIIERANFQPIFRGVLRLQVCARGCDGRLAHGAAAVEHSRFDCGAGIHRYAHREEISTE